MDNSLSFRVAEDGSISGICRSDWMEESEKNLQSYVNIIHWFITVIQPTPIYAYPPDLFRVAFNLVGILAMAGIGILSMLVMCCTGCCYCCCQRRKRCGGQKKLTVGRYDDKKKIIFTVILAPHILILFISCSTALVCSSQLTYRLEGTSWKDPFDLINLGLEAMGAWIDFIVRKDFDPIAMTVDKVANETKVMIDNILDHIFQNVRDSLDITETFLLFDDLAKTINETYTVLENIDVTVKRLRRNSATLQNNLTEIKQACPRCPADILQLSADFNRVPDVTTELNILKPALDMQKRIDEAKTDFKYKESEARQSVVDKVKEAKDLINDMHEKATDQMDSLRKNLTDYANLAKNATQKVKELETSVRQQTLFVATINVMFSTIIILTCFMLLSGLLFLLGLLGVWLPFLSQKWGCRFLFMAIVSTFIFYGLIMLLSTVLFVPGSAVFAMLCRYFNSDKPTEPISYLSWLSRTPQLKNIMGNFTFNITHGLASCVDNKGAFTALNLETNFNLDELLSAKQVDDAVAKLEETDLQINRVKILTPELTQDIDKFGTSAADKLNISAFNEQISKQIMLDPETVAQRIEKSPNPTGQPAITDTFQRAAAKVRATKTLYDALVSDKDILGQLIKTASQNKNFEEKTIKIKARITKTENQFNNEFVAVAKQTVTNESQKLGEFVKQNLDEIKTTIRTEFAKCRDLVDVVYLMSDSVCSAILDPLNGIWFSWGQCLLMLIPSIIYAHLLMWLFKPIEFRAHIAESCRQISPLQVPLTSQVTSAPAFPPAQDIRFAVSSKASANSKSSDHCSCPSNDLSVVSHKMQIASSPLPICNSTHNSSVTMIPDCPSSMKKEEKGTTGEALPSKSPSDVSNLPPVTI